MSQVLLLRLQQAAQLAAASNSSSLLPAAATAAQTCGIWTAAALWKQQQQHPQHPHSLQQLHSALLQLPQQHIQQQPGAEGFSTCTAAADAALLRLNIPEQQLPCMLRTSRGSRQRLGNANTVKYPYRLPPVYSSRSWQLRDLEGWPKGAVELPGDIFNVPVRIDIMHQVVRWQRAKARQGTHKTKERHEVSGGGKKPWQQKGSGRARQGSIRAPQWRGGGIVHGPKPRSYAFSLNKKVRRLGLRCALSAKANEGRLILVDSLAPPADPLRPFKYKTKVMAAKLQGLINTQATAAAAAGQLLMGAADAGLSGLVIQQLRLQQQQQQQPLLPAASGAGSPAAEGQQQQQQKTEQGEQQDLSPMGLLKAVGQQLQPQQGEEGAGDQVGWEQQQQQQQQQRRLQQQHRVSAVIIDSAKAGPDGGEPMRRAVRNLPDVEVVPALGANVLSLMRRDYVILTKPGLDAVIERLQRPINRLGAAGIAFRHKLQQRRAAAARAALIQQNLTPAVRPQQQQQQHKATA